VAGAAENAGPRVVLKVHFAICPRAVAPLGRLLGRLSVHYNANFRKLFLATLWPDSLLSRLMAGSVLAGTWVFNHIELAVGFANIIHVAAVGALALLFRSYALFFHMTSFVHYFIYLGTYHQRAGIAFGAFKRAALLYKSLALSQSAVQFALLVDYEAPPLLPLLLICCGFGLATLSAAVLGVDRTYFGWELGQLRGEYVERFPYGVIPHPMILGGIVGARRPAPLPPAAHAFSPTPPPHVPLLRRLARLPRPPRLPRRVARLRAAARATLPRPRGAGALLHPRHRRPARLQRRQRPAGRRAARSR
jgi:hypothetical protein